jgi:hypothetical protein
MDEECRRKILFGCYPRTRSQRATYGMNTLEEEQQNFVARGGVYNGYKIFWYEI